MSRRPEAAKLNSAMTEMPQPSREPHAAPDAVELLVRFVPLADPPAGSVLDQAGAEQRFSGWLGLLRVLEDHHATGAAPREPLPAKETP